MTKRAHLRPWRRPGVAAFIATVLAISGLWGAPLAGAAPGDDGPLDPLSAAEIATTVQTIEASNKYLAGSFFPIVTLKEPPKAELLAWDPGEPFRRESFANVYNRAANRLFEAVVDLKTQKPISWVERPGIKPVNTTLSGSSTSTRPGLKPLNVVQPDGPSFTLTGDKVEWMGWQFRVGFNPREGLVLHEIGFKDDGALRPIIQRMALDEIFVPYAL